MTVGQRCFNGGSGTCSCDGGPVATAGSAGERLVLHHTRARAEGRITHLRRRGAEDRYHGGPHGGRHVGRSAVVADQDSRTGQQRDQLTDAGLPREHGGRLTHQRVDLLTQLPFARRSDQYRREPEAAGSDHVGIYMFNTKS